MTKRPISRWMLRRPLPGQPRAVPGAVGSSRGGIRFTPLALSQDRPADEGPDAGPEPPLEKSPAGHRPPLFTLSHLLDLLPCLIRSAGGEDGHPDQRRTSWIQMPRIDAQVRPSSTAVIKLLRPSPLFMRQLAYSRSSNRVRILETTMSMATLL